MTEGSLAPAELVFALSSLELSESILGLIFLRLAFANEPSLKRTELGRIGLFSSSTCELIKVKLKPKALGHYNLIVIEQAHKLAGVSKFSVVWQYKVFFPLSLKVV